MICSDARLAANRLNALKSTGPKTEQGKAISRRNGLKHGLAGSGAVVAEAEAGEIARRVEALTVEMAPSTEAGSLLILSMATLSVRAERAGEHELAAVALKVRHAGEDFDEAREAEADRLFEALEESPTRGLRKLRRMPEGVDRMLEEWADLRGDLGRDIASSWTASHMVRGAALVGVKADHARQSRVGVLSRAVWGDFAGLDPADGPGLGEEARQRWAKARLRELIDSEMAALRAHRETLDFETIELDRIEAPARALFDDSKGACLARRYEGEARRGFFKALQEFRRVEGEAVAVAEGGSPRQECPKVGSGGDRGVMAVVEPPRPDPDAFFARAEVVKGPDGLPLCVGRRPKSGG